MQENGRFRWNADEGFKPLWGQIMSSARAKAGGGSQQGIIGPSPSYPVKRGQS